MSLFAARLPRHIRAFHSPFVALSASSRLTPSSPPPPTPAPVYEKQDDSSPEPRLSSSGTRTYVVSEPDPSHTPYQVPSGAYPAAASYVSFGPTSNSDALPQRHPYQARTGGDSAAVKNTEGLGDRGASHGSIGLMDAASTKPGKF